MESECRNQAVGILTENCTKIFDAIQRWNHEAANRRSPPTKVALAKSLRISIDQLNYALKLSKAKKARKTKAKAATRVRIDLRLTKLCSVLPREAKKMLQKERPISATKKKHHAKRKIQFSAGLVNDVMNRPVSDRTVLRRIKVVSEKTAHVREAMKAELRELRSGLPLVNQRSICHGVGRPYGSQTFYLH